MQHRSVGGHHTSKGDLLLLRTRHCVAPLPRQPHPRLSSWRRGVALGKNGLPEEQPGDAAASSSLDKKPALSSESRKLPLRPATPGTLNIAYESEKESSLKPVVDASQTTGLHRAPLSGGVTTATARSGGGGGVANQSWMDGVTNNVDTILAFEQDPAGSNAGNTASRCLASRWPAAAAGCMP